MIYSKQLKSLIARTLLEYDLYSEEAVQLVHGTIIQESLAGTYIRQVTDNFDIHRHGLGIAQCEHNTFKWLKKVFVGKYPQIRDINFIELEYNLKYSILFCRFRYLVDPSPIPKTIEKQAHYWKRIYNTIHGSGKPEQYISNYNKYA